MRCRGKTPAEEERSRSLRREGEGEGEREIGSRRKERAYLMGLERRLTDRKAEMGEEAISAFKKATRGCGRRSVFIG